MCQIPKALPQILFSENEDLHNFNSSPNLIVVNKSRRMISGACGTHGKQ
jgi:hypothetical protein